MKIAATIASILLALVFLMASVPFLLNLPMPEPKTPLPPDVLTFMGVFGPTGYMKFVKIFEFLGAILVAIPYTRNFGLLVLGPIIVNILAFNALIFRALPPDAMSATMLVLIIVLPLFLLWHARRKFLGLLG